MLKKVLKYEWISTGRILVILHIALAIVTLLGNIEVGYLKSKIGYLSVNGGTVQMEGALGALTVAGIVAYILIVFAAVVGTMVYLIVRYYKSMYTDEGYLTHTLPVQTHTIMLGKMIVAVCWMMIDVIAVVLSAWSIISRGIGIRFAEVWSEITNALSQAGIRNMLWTFIVLAVIDIILCTLSRWEQVTASFALGQLSNDHKILMSVASYIGLNIVLQIIGFIFGINTSKLFFGIEMGGINQEPAQVVMKMMIMMAVYSAIITAVFYIISYFITKKKLNIE